MSLKVVIPPAGVSALSFFTPTEFVDPAKPPAILADKIDPHSGEIISLLEGMHPIDAAVAFNFRVRRASGAAVTDVGQRFADVKKNDDAAARTLQLEAQRILKPFVDANMVRQVRAVSSADPDSDLGAVYVEYVNVQTAKRRLQTLDGRNQPLPATVSA